ncbi:MAG: viologen exporter family transport system permease protein [Gaiellaceae bacterium]|nr:viologen exporter family transport system permease protein [Gaiellaceae bacterium]
MSARVVRQEPWLRSMADFYATTIRTQIQTQFQYRVALYMYTVGMVTEPVIYLVVWTTIARSHGGTVGGLTAGSLAAYYIVWTLVRMMNIVFTPFGWEGRIREGELSGQLLRPLHPIHYDLASFAGQKIPWFVLYLPIGVALSLIFHPTLDPRPIEIAVFLVAIWGAYVIRSLNNFSLGMLTFWTTRVGAIFQVWFLGELLLSGRLLPLTLMPRWAQTLADWLPFKYTFYFPIEALVGNMSTASLLGGLGMQVVWAAAGAAVALGMWRIAVRRYSAVGN